MFNEKRIGAVILAGGKGRRMNTDIPKQYSVLYGRPMIAWSLMAFDKSPVDELVLVTAAGEENFVKEKILPDLALSGLAAVVPGGEERCDSVYEGLKALDGHGCDIVLIHDGARPLVTEDIIERVMEGAAGYEACVAAMPVKDTIRIADDDGFASSDLDRSHLFQMQTPQGFDFLLIKRAFDEFMTSGKSRTAITDDAMLAEMIPGTRIKLEEGSYENIKVTTPGDLVMAEAILTERMR